MDKIIVIYHRADFDGIFCREIARKYFKSIEAVIADQTVEYIGWDYGDPVPVIPPNASLYMLDISVEALMAYPELVWIDHHKSAMEKFSSGIHGYRIDGVAACRLAYQWFFHPPKVGPFPTKENFVNREVAEPWAVRLAGEYDIWDKRDPDAELFQHGLRSRNIDNDWPLMLSFGRTSSIDEIEALIAIGHRDLLNPDGTERNPIVIGLLENGRSIQYAKTKENESIIKASGFTAEIDGLKVLACNHARFNSHLFTAGLKPEHEACLGYNFTGKHWRVSLYHAPGKEHHDLSKIAVAHGGGGHRGACGFTSKDLSFLTLTEPL